MVGYVLYLDSGASFHMSGDKNLFSTLEEKDLQMRIKMGDDGRYRVSGEGTVVFQREHGAPLTLTDVKYVPVLKKNLVFVAMLEDKGYDVVFSKGNVFLRHIGTRKTKRIEIRVKNLYKLEVDDYVTLSSKAEDRDSRAGAILERIHTNVCGPFSTASTAKQRYYVIFIDDFSRRCWIYFMQKKDQTFLRFCKFKALAQKTTRNKIKAFHSDGSGKYVTQQFKDFYVAEGIKWELTAPHNPQQNGVAKRKNRSIVGAA
eukprot:PITA_17428